MVIRRKTTEFARRPEDVETILRSHIILRDEKLKKTTTAIVGFVFEGYK